MINWLGLINADLSREPLLQMFPTMRTWFSSKTVLCFSLTLIFSYPTNAASFFDKFFKNNETTANHLNIVKVLEKQFPLVDGWQTQINRLYFDNQNKLYWNSASIKTLSTPCLTKANEYQRKTLILNPRVDQVHCASVDNKTGDTSFLVRLDSAGQAIWQRDLIFNSGEFKIKEYVRGATLQGIVLNNLTVLSPLSGEILIPSKLKSEKQSPLVRPIPLHSVSRASAYIPERKGFISYTADVTLVKKTGGLYFIDEFSGKKELWLPVVITYRAAWNVLEMAPIPGGRYLLLAHKLDLRGSNRVSMAVFDLDTRKIVYEERFGENECCDSPQLIVGEDGNFGFAFIYRTTKESKRVLIHYRLPKP
jgi:hypothetical protein